MTATDLPLLVEPAQLAHALGAPDLRIVDLNQPHVYLRAHVPGAVSLDYTNIVAAKPPASAVLPSLEKLEEVLGALGLLPEHHIVAYDDEGNGRAARFLWTLDALGHPRKSLLNGGLKAWLAEQHSADATVPTVAPTQYGAQLRGDVVVDKDYILAHLADPAVVLLDARSPEEYQGKIQRAMKSGHIPGALNFNWTDAMDPARFLRLKNATELKQKLERLGVTPDKEIITYCQTHHRSAHTYLVLKILGYPRVKAYPGSWSEWGNLPDTPIE